MQLPIYHHPSLTVLVDDSDSFLRSLSFQLDPDLASKCFHDTRSALDWLNAQPHVRAPAAGAVQASFDTYGSTPEQCNVAIDIDRIHRISTQPQRFMTPSVLVVDYSMPQMNGVEFCAALAHLPCKKILFTGAADEKIAVDAFNRGLIDRYIKKSADDALDRLEEQIVALQAAYFSAQSEMLRDLLAVHHYTFVSDPALVRVVAEIRARHAIVEHYLYPNPAGILFYDSRGKARLMVVETEESMESHYEMARDNAAPMSLLAALEARCIIPYFHEGDGMYSAAFCQRWHQYCQPAQICEGRQRYYWALFELTGPVAPEPVFPFAQFLREQHVN